VKPACGPEPVAQTSSGTNLSCVASGAGSFAIEKAMSEIGPHAGRWSDRLSLRAVRAAAAVGAEAAAGTMAEGFESP
jgi:hypothetical protein